MFRKISFLVIYHLGKVDSLIQKSFRVIPKITIDNLRKAIHDVIIIPVSSDPLKIEAVERKGKNYKKNNISRTKELLRRNKNNS